jgi:hypothetical protein
LNLLKPPKENNRPRGENSPNLVTLVVAHVFAHNGLRGGRKSFPSFMNDFAVSIKKILDLHDP